jgi:DNA-directed RNA polymerase subunit RPC12/RpoP
MEVSYTVWRGAPLEMNGELKQGLEYKRPRRLKCDRCGSRRPNKQKKKKKKNTNVNLF